jgi:hypothetical protein
MLLMQPPTRHISLQMSLLTKPTLNPIATNGSLLTVYQSRYHPLNVSPETGPVVRYHLVDWKQVWISLTYSRDGYRQIFGHKRHGGP